MDYDTWSGCCVFNLSTNTCVCLFVFCFFPATPITKFRKTFDILTSAILNNTTTPILGSNRFEYLFKMNSIAEAVPPFLQSTLHSAVTATKI